MSEFATHAAIEAVARNSYGRFIAYIAARSGDVAAAEDALSDAIAVALERWPAGRRSTKTGGMAATCCAQPHN